MRQTCAATPGQKSKQPFVIPVRAALFSHSGEKLLLNDEANELTLILDNRSKPITLALTRTFTAAPYPPCSGDSAHRLR